MISIGLIYSSCNGILAYIFGCDIIYIDSNFVSFKEFYFYFIYNSYIFLSSYICKVSI